MVARHDTEQDSLWSTLQRASKPDVRSFVVNRLQKAGTDPRGLVERLKVESDVSTRRALLLAIGEYSEADLGASFVDRLRELFRNDPDSGIHSAVEWVLRRWGHDDAISTLSPTGPEEGKSWFVTPQQQAFTIARGPVTFKMGSPSYEVNRMGNESLHERRISRSFAFANTPVTVEQYQKFLDANPGRPSIRWAEYSPDDRCPVTGANWYHAVEYCNWLSSVEGLEPVYVPNANGNYNIGMSFHDDCLNRSGYRLPTRAEWEYMARAGASTAWSFGDTPELLPNYGWFVENSGERSLPVGSLKPNDFGLFDTHGNVLEWLHQSRGIAIGRLKEDREAPFTRASLLAGGSFRRFPRDSRCAFVRGYVSVTTGYADGGFRVCRTLQE